MDIQDLIRCLEEIESMYPHQLVRIQALTRDGRWHWVNDADPFTFHDSEGSTTVAVLKLEPAGPPAVAVPKQYRCPYKHCGFTADTHEEIDEHINQEEDHDNG